MTITVKVSKAGSPDYRFDLLTFTGPNGKVSIAGDLSDDYVIGVWAVFCSLNETKDSAMRQAVESLEMLLHT